VVQKNLGFNESHMIIIRLLIKILMNNNDFNHILMILIISYSQILTQNHLVVIEKKTRIEPIFFFLFLLIPIKNHLMFIIMNNHLEIKSYYFNEILIIEMLR